MTTRFSTLSTLNETMAVHRGRGGFIALWVTQIAVAGTFMLAGGMKLAGAPQMVALFDEIGVGQWFRYVTGAIEVGSAVALLVPSLAPFGALVLVPTMVGAIATHLFLRRGSAIPSTVLLIAAVAIVWAHRDQVARALSRLH